MLGKRSRQPMKRTTSMSQITYDLNADCSETAPPSIDNPSFDQKQVGFGSHPYHWPSAAGTAARRTTQPQRASADFLETAHFLRSCSLCKRRLLLNRDIYMRGDSAFCSLECRQLQMNHDERKGQCSIASKNEATSSTAAVSDVPSKGETVVAL